MLSRLSITIRHTKTLPFDKVVELFFEVGFLQHKDKTKIYHQAIEKAFINSQYVVSAWNGKQLIGFARVLSDNTIFATIWNVIVAPKYQKQGIGELMMKDILNKYDKHAVFLIGDENVEKFYEKMGFTKHAHGMYLKVGRDNCIIYN